MGGRGAYGVATRARRVTVAAQQRQQPAPPQQAQQQPQPAPQPQPQPKVSAAADYDSINWDNLQFRELTQQEYDDIYKNNRDRYTGNVKMAKKMYEADVTVPGTTQSYSQNMNHQINAGLKLSADSKFMQKYLTQAMHPIGQSCTMTRLAHETMLNQFIKQAGLRGTYENYTESQLKSALVGGEFSMKSFGSFSTSSNANPFKSLGSRELIIKARTAPSTKVVSGARKQHEVITGQGQRARVTDIKFTNKTAYTASGKSKPVVELYVDLW